MQIASTPAPTAASLPGASAASSAGDSWMTGSAVTDFLSFARETPAQQMRDSILHQLGLTEDDLKAMSPQDRAKVEEKIEALVRQKVEQSTEKKTGMIVDVQA